MSAYYNEIDEYAAQWLRNLIAAGHIAPGDVDTRSITEVHPDDIKNYNQCHFFAGIGVWSYALRRAGWADSRPVWTGSCPCQPFSIAGKGDGFDDERHLWPVFGNLIRERRPPTVFGEQVASKDADAWIDLAQADLEAMGYAVGAVPFPAAGVGAPHIRDRLYWMGDSGSAGLEGHHRHGGDGNESGRYNAQSTGPVGATGGFSGLADAMCSGLLPGPYARIHSQEEGSGSRNGKSERFGTDGRLADTNSDGCKTRIITAATVGQGNTAIADGGFCGLANTESTGFAHGRTGTILAKPSAIGGKVSTASASPLNGFWRDADWLLCRDGKWRPVEPGTFPLAHGITNRVGRLRAYGNAICAEAAVEFIKAAMEYRP